MLIQNTLSSRKNNKQQSFGYALNGATQVLRFLNTSPAIGATGVDIGSMSAPRTIIDGSKRGFNAGVETGIREGSGTTNHALIGTYGMIAGALLSQGLNKKFGVQSNKVFANFDTIETIGTIWNNIVQKNKSATPTEMRKQLFSKVLSEVRGNVQNAKGELERIPIDKKSINSFMEEISKYIDENPNSYKLPSNLFNRLKTIIGYSTAAESDFLLTAAKNSAKSDLDTLIKSTFSLGKLFSEPKALESFRKSAELGANKFVKALKSTKLKASLLGVAIGMGVGAMVQPFNVWLTKKRTGVEGFVGVENGKKDDSLKFKLLKGTTAAGFLAFAYSTIVGNIFKIPLKKQLGLFLNKMQFNGFIPSLPQFKAIYGFTIASRILSAREGNEYRETMTKDPLGFVNWLILGDFVQKIVATFSNKNLTNYSEKDHGKGLLNKIFNLDVKVKTHDEILFEELKKKKLDMSSMTSIDGKMLSARDLLKKYVEKIPSLKARIKGKNIAQFAGYLYSALVLGIFIPKLNIAVTNYVQNKKKKQQESDNHYDNTLGTGRNFRIIYKKSA